VGDYVYLQQTSPMTLDVTVGRTTSQSGDPFVLVLFKCFHNTFTRCPRFSDLFV